MSLGVEIGQILDCSVSTFRQTILTVSVLAESISYLFRFWYFMLKCELEDI